MSATPKAVVCGFVSSRSSGDPAGWDARHRAAQRPAHAVVPGTDEIAHGVLEVHTDERRLAAVDMPVHEREVHGAVDVILVAHEPERSGIRVDVTLGDAFDRALLLEPITDQVGDRADPETMMPSSLSTSTMTPAGSNPASLARSQPASVCPARVNTPPG